MDVEIISVEMIKPSSPTPPHLRNYKLCLLDQLIPAAYAPIVFFYPNHSNLRVVEKLDLLKRSLSVTLTRFFVLAGTTKDDLSIDCDDHGARFTTAKIASSCNLNDFLECPDLKMMANFLPCELSHVTNIQATEFECGGIALGVCISHRVLDGAALSNFLKSWANAATSSNLLLGPDFSASHLFPANDSWLKDASMAMWGSLFKKGRFVTRRFVFHGSSVAYLKDRATGNTGTTPTRVEAVSGFIWKYAMTAAEEIVGSKKPSLLTHLVNLRKRAAPNFSQESLGNLIWIASGMCGVEKQDFGLAELVGEVRRSISRVDGDYVKKLRGEKGSNMMKKCIKEVEEVGRRNVHHLGFSSWCKLGFYEVDFGWGKPVWVSSIDSSGAWFMNLVVLMDCRYGDGVEAWVTMDEQEINVLENNQEFRTLALLNPSPLSIGNAVV